MRRLQVVGQPLQFHLPHARSIAVAAARIGGDQERRRPADRPAVPSSSTTGGSRRRRTRACRGRGPRSPTLRCAPCRRRRTGSLCRSRRPGKSCTRTASGVPVGCHSCPAFLKSPTNSFFFVSTEITGCWRCRNAAAVALMCSNCALRSGCDVPFATLADRLQPVAQGVQQTPHRRGTHVPALRRQRGRQLRAALARPPQRRHRIAARQRLHQRLQRGLSPPVACRRCRDGPPRRAECAWSAPRPRASSRRPFRIVSRASPVAADTSASPP